MNRGDIETHTGIVTGSYDDLTISALIPALNEGEIDNIRPEFVSPIRWRPRENDRVTIYRRLGALRPEVSLTWVGWAYDSGDTHLVPPWSEPGDVVIMGTSGRVQIVLADDDADSANGTPGQLRLGYREADEPLVLGDAWKTQETRILDEVTRALTATSLFFGLLETALATAGIAIGPAVAAWRDIVIAGTSLPTLPGAAVSEQLTGATVPAGADVKSLLATLVSDYVFTSKDPDPEPFDGEEG